MSTSIEKIDLIKERANVSYSMAKEALEKNNNDVVEALIYLENQSKLKEQEETFQKKFKSTGEDAFEATKKAFNKGKKVKFILANSNGDVVINVTLWIALLIVLVTMPFSLVVLALVILFKNKIRIIKSDGTEANLSDIVDVQETTIVKEESTETKKANATEINIEENDQINLNK